MNWKRMPRGLKWTILSLVGFILAVVLFLAFFDWNLLRGHIAAFASKRINREVSIERLDAHLLTRRPTIQVSGLRIGNPQWADSKDMVDVRDINIEFKWGPLFVGNLVVTRAVVDSPQVMLLRQSLEQVNWQFGTPRAGQRRKAGGEPTDLPEIRNFTLRNGRIQVVDRIRKLTFSGVVEAGERVGQAEALPFKLEGDGELNKKRFDLNVRGGPLLNVRRDKPYAFDAHIVAGTTRVVAHGAIIKPFNFGQLEVALNVSGDDLANLYYLTGLALPNTPPYKVTAKLRRDGMQFFVNDFDGKIGDSDIHGDLSIDAAPERPVLRGELVSKSLDLDDLAASLGAAPQATSGETISPAQRKLGRQMAQNARLFPDAKLQVERVRGMDADVKFKAMAVTARKIPIREVAFRLKLDNALMTIDPLSFVLPQGKFTGSVQLNARGDVPESSADIRISGVQLGQFRMKSTPQPPLEGLLLGRIQIKGRGDSILKVVSTGEGAVTAVVPRGEIREAFAELTGINVAKGLGLLLSKDQQQVKVRCGIADFKLHQGKLTAENLVFDTENVLITGAGNIRLDAELADITIKGRPKELRFFRLRAPIVIQGPLRKPQVGVKGKDLAQQTGVAAALAALAAPIAAVLAFVDPGLADDADCSALLAEAQKKTATDVAGVHKAVSRK